MRRAAIVLAGALAAAACGGDDAAGPDGGGPDAEACAADDQGSCDGDVLTRCQGGLLQITDCGDDLGVCAFVDDATGFACVDECVEAGVDEDGVCDGDAVRRCDTVDGHHRVVVEPCGATANCVQPAGEPAACVADACTGVGPLGHCDGDTLTTCAGGTPSSTDCAATGDVCGYAGDATGYACIDPASTGAFRVEGTIRYEDRPPLSTGALGGITPVVVRGARVTVVADSGGAVLGTSVTSDDGTYVVYYDATAGDAVHVMVAAQSPYAGRPARVLRTNTAVHGFGGATFDAAADVTQDVLVTDASSTSEAFNVLDQMVSGFDVMREAMGVTNPEACAARWTRGSNNGTYYSGNTLFLLGASSDDDGYDDTVILHEFGHFVEDTVGRTDSPGGGHDGSPTDPNLAWSEGFSTYFNMAVRDAPLYMDSNSGGGWGYNADTSVTAASAGGGMAQDVSEDMISEVLWDIGDGGAGDDDAMTSGTHRAVLRVQPEYLRTATLRGGNEPGVDLVDFLDGWFVGNGLSSCAGVRAVVTTVRSFPYDYAGPAGSCP